MPSLSSLMARVFLLYFALFRSGHKNCTRFACEDGRDWVAFILSFPSKDNRDFGVQIIVISISFNARDIYAQMYIQHGYNAAFRYNYKHFNYSTLRLNRTTIFLTASWFACKQWQKQKLKLKSIILFIRFCHLTKSLTSWTVSCENC